MRRLVSVVVVVNVCAVLGLLAQGQKFGTALTLTEVTKISDIYASPDKFDGKRVQVQGPIVDVCSEAGCWLALGSDKEPQTLRFQLENGMVVFPASVKGLKAKVEGILTVTKGPGPGVSIRIPDQLSSSHHGGRRAAADSAG